DEWCPARSPGAAPAVDPPPARPDSRSLPGEATRGGGTARHRGGPAGDDPRRRAAGSQVGPADGLRSSPPRRAWRHRLARGCRSGRSRGSPHRARAPHAGSRLHAARLRGRDALPREDGGQGAARTVRGGLRAANRGTRLGDRSLACGAGTRREHPDARGPLRRSRLAGARAVRPARRALRGSSRPASHHDARDLGRASPSQGLRVRHRVSAVEMSVQVQSAIRAGVDPHLSPRSLDPEADLMLLHFGPQHPSTHGVFRMDLLLDGEIVVKATPYVGYLHRAVEKLCEKLTYTQMTPIVDKNDYVAPMTNEQALNM